MVIQYRGMLYKSMFLSPCLLFRRQETSALVFEEAKVCLLTHVLQCLVFASGVDWAQDKELLKLILTLGHILAVTLNNSL